MSSILVETLKSLARGTISRHKPLVVAITGSLGKTSTREAIACILQQKYKTRAAVKSFNTELGIPLAIFGIKDYPGKNIFSWLKVFTQAIWQRFGLVTFPQSLVLEMGIDKPGEMDRLLSLAQPDIGVLTGVGLSHAEFFESLESLASEKGKLLKAVKPNGVAIYNSDNNAAAEIANKLRVKTISYGQAQGSDIRLLSLDEEFSSKPITKAVVSIDGTNMEFSLKSIGHTHVYAALAAIAVAKFLKIESDLLAKGLEHIRPYPGRLNIIPGIKHTILIDDTYNAADPAGVYEALRVLEGFRNRQKLIVIGDMLELGAFSDKQHQEVGERIAELNPILLVTVGDGGRVISRAAQSKGFPLSKVLNFDTSREASKVVQEKLQPDWVVLLKGSQGKRIEIITKEIMAEPMRANELITRQYGKWLQS